MEGSVLSFLSPSGQFGLMSDDLPKIVNGNFLKHLHHFCISDDQGFSFYIDNFNCRDEIFKIHPFLWNFLFRSSGQFGLMSDDLLKIVNGNFLKHLHHFCISDDQGFSFLVHSTIKVLSLLL
jgi:hypothetical protein